jgi:hypothetical protein
MSYRLNDPDFQIVQNVPTVSGAKPISYSTGTAGKMAGA